MEVHPRTRVRDARATPSLVEYGRKKPDRRASVLSVLIGLALLSNSLVLSACGNAWRTGFPGPVTRLSVEPASITVPAQSTTRFAAVFAPSPPGGGQVTWSVSPAEGGTITSSGLYTASATAGNYAVIATWVPLDATAGNKIRGSAMVSVLALPPPELNTDLTQASGAFQSWGPIQHAAIVGQLVPLTTSEDSTGSVQVDSGFSIPVACREQGSDCH